MLGSRFRCAWYGALAVVVAAGPAFSSDGVIEINQARALAGGVTASDAPGFPVTLDVEGSYELTGNLSPPASKGALEIAANAVTLDLNGFSITGTATCTGFPVTSCTTHGGAGILDPVASRTGTVVRNGAILGMDAGINLGNRAMVEGVRVLANGGDGITLGPFGRVRASVAGGNAGSWGIYVWSDGRVESSDVHGNKSHGIGVGPRSAVERNRVYLNLGDGIVAAAPSDVSENVVTSNSVYGVLIQNGSLTALSLLGGNVLTGNALGTVSPCPGLGFWGTNGEGLFNGNSVLC